MIDRHSTYAVSPTLIPAAPAYELKFLVTEPIAGAIEARAAEWLAYDAHCDLTSGRSYAVTSVYYDSPELGVLRRLPGCRVHKFRVRRYDMEPLAHVERKSKRSGRVWKIRTTVPLATLDDTRSGPALGTVTQWFDTAVAERRLQPVCKVTYRRIAMVGHAPAGPMRLTFDRQAQCMVASRINLEPVAVGTRVVEDGVIVEMKYLQTLPVQFKDLVEEWRLTPANVSKYRRGAVALQLWPVAREVRDA
jgi:hypothetical protein